MDEDTEVERGDNLPKVTQLRQNQDVNLGGQTLDHYCASS